MKLQQAKVKSVLSGDTIIVSAEGEYDHSGLQCLCGVLWYQETIGRSSLVAFFNGRLLLWHAFVMADQF